MESGDEIVEVWRVSRETDELEAELAAARAKREALESGLQKCPVCGRAAQIVEFGLEGNGVWIGCDETAECSRYIEYHAEGWSIEEAAAEWNKYNSGIFLVLRKVKMWFRRHFGAEKRAEKRKNRELLQKKRAELQKMRELFGIEVQKRARWWDKIRFRKVHKATS